MVTQNTVSKILANLFNYFLQQKKLVIQGWFYRPNTKVQLDYMSIREGPQLQLLSTTQNKSTRFWELKYRRKKGKLLEILGLIIPQTCTHMHKIVGTPLLTHNGHWNNLKLTNVIINKNVLKMKRWKSNIAFELWFNRIVLKNKLMKQA